MNRLLFFITLIGSLLACSKYYSHQDLVSYILNPENGLSMEYFESGYKWSSNFIPNDIMIFNEIKRKSFKGNIKQLKQQYGTQYYFSIAVSKNDQELYSPYGMSSDKSSSISFLLNRIDEMIFLETSNGEIVHPVIQFVPKTYGMSPETKIIVGFNVQNINSSEWIRLNLVPPGLGASSQFFKYLLKDIQRVPHIKFNENEKV